jgi:hypothetical protein
LVTGYILQSPNGKIHEKQNKQIDIECLALLMTKINPVVFPFIFRCDEARSLSYQSWSLGISLRLHFDSMIS